MSNNKAVLDKLAEAWNEFLAISESEGKKADLRERSIIRDELDEFRRGINNLQRVVSTRELRQSNSEFFK